MRAIYGYCMLTREVPTIACGSGYTTRVCISLTSKGSASHSGAGDRKPRLVSFVLLSKSLASFLVALLTTLEDTADTLACGHRFIASWQSHLDRSKLSTGEALACAMWVSCSVCAR